MTDGEVSGEDHGSNEHHGSNGGGDGGFVIACQSAAAPDSTKGALHHPPARVNGNATLAKLSARKRDCNRRGGGNAFAGIGAVGKAAGGGTAKAVVQAPERDGGNRPPVSTSTWRLRPTTPLAASKPPSARRARTA